MVLSCPKCGRQIRDEDAVYCPFCSSVLKAGAVRHTDFPIAGGVLLILAASMCLLAGMVAMASFISSVQSGYYYDYPGQWRYYAPRYWDLFAATFGLVAFVYGLAGGILSVKRRKFAHCVAGGLLTILEGFAVVFAFAQPNPTVWIIGVLFGAPVIILSTPALLFVSISKEEFK